MISHQPDRWILSAPLITGRISMQSEHKIFTSDQKSQLLLTVLCQIACFFAVLLLLGWGLSRI